MKHIKGKSFAVNARTQGQNNYIDALDTSDLIFGIGAAGTGKTFLATAKAVQKLQNKEVEKIILTRPVVEAGESLGFLPGTFEEKLDPYLIPLIDSLRKLIPQTEIEKRMTDGTIEIAPLAYMRGRTLENAFIILDEAQNTTQTQMKLFLTRFGRGSTMVINGDITQTDLPKKVQSGLTHYKAFENIKGVSVVEFQESDIVRHKLVSKIIEVYNKIGG